MVLRFYRPERKRWGRKKEEEKNNNKKKKWKSRAEPAGSSPSRQQISSQSVESWVRHGLLRGSKLEESKVESFAGPPCRLAPGPGVDAQTAPCRESGLRQKENGIRGLKSSASLRWTPRNASAMTINSAGRASSNPPEIRGPQLIGRRRDSGAGSGPTQAAVTPPNIFRGSKPGRDTGGPLVKTSS